MPLYIALVSSLPALEMEGDTFMTKEKFLSWCEGTVPEKELEKLAKFTPRSGADEFPASSFAGKYLQWECALRNACVRIRAGKIGTDPRKWLREEGKEELSAESAASAAFASGDPLVREQLLDAARWAKAEELESRERYTLNRLYAYKLKLEIRESWLARDPRKAAENMDRAAAAVCGTKS